MCGLKFVEADTDASAIFDTGCVLVMGGRRMTVVTVRSINVLRKCICFQRGGEFVVTKRGFVVAAEAVIVVVVVVETWRLGPLEKGFPSKC